MKRWMLFSPRLMVAAALLLLVLLCANGLLRWSVVRQIRSATGAQVEIDSLRSNFWTGRLQLSKFRLSDPADASRSLIQADAAVVQVNPYRVWHREWVLDSGFIRDLKLEPRSPQDFASRDHWCKECARGAQKASRQIAEQFQVPEFEPGKKPYAIVRCAAELREAWQRDIKSANATMSSLKQRLETLQQQLSEPSRNPLRDDRHADYCAEALKLLNQEYERAERLLQELQAKVEAGRQSLLDAKESDTRDLREQSARWYVDGQTLSRSLIGAPQIQTAQDALAWVDWFRTAALDPLRIHRPTATEGVDVVFSKRNQPSFVARQLQLQCDGMLAGSEHTFRGSAQNIALQPANLAEPTVIQLRSMESPEISIRAELDRRSRSGTDHITFAADELSMPEWVMGHDAFLSLVVAPGNWSIDGEIHLQGDSLSGGLRIVQTEAVVHARHAAVAPQEEAFAASIDRELAEHKDITMEIRFAGTLADPQLELACDLGPKLCAVIHQAIKDQLETALESQLQHLDDYYEAELQQLDQQSSRLIAEFTEGLRNDQSRMAQISDRIPSRQGFSRMR